MMRDLAEQFRATMTLPVLLQGETSKGQLLQQFVSAGNALLVATSSFWEGVDVRGDTLSLVIIDKLPFTSPDDPLLKARMEDCRLRGGDPFDEVQLPDAVITLKQGVGRLIRDADDRGVLVICDNRLVMRPYGATFLASLPPAPRTRVHCPCGSFPCDTILQVICYGVWYDARLFIDLSTKTHANSGYRYRDRGLLCRPVERRYCQRSF